MIENSVVPQLEVEGLTALLKVYEEIEKANERQRSIYGFNCPPDCSKCCGTSAENIEATVFEMIPMALHLHGTGLSDYFYTLIRERGYSSPCVMHSPDKQLFTGSGCAAYQWRPLLCRLFGYSSVIDKYGIKRFSACREMKSRYSGITEKMNSIIIEDENIPENCSVAMKVYQLNPDLASKFYGINEALLRAIEYTGLRMDYSSKMMDPLNDTPPCAPDGQRTA